jgi:Domain of unknown function (DUF477).
MKTGKKQLSVLILSILILLFLGGTFLLPEGSADSPHVHDDADLLTQEEEESLESLASEISDRHETEFVVYTTFDTEGKDIADYIGDLYDEGKLGYEKPHGNAAILAVDMENRVIQIMGFKKAETYLSNARIEQILDDITPMMSDGDYYSAFQTFLEEADEYMGMEPDEGPGLEYGYGPEEDYAGIGSGESLESILAKWWVQLILSFLIGGAVVAGLYTFTSGKRSTVNEGTYRDPKTSRILERRDVFVRRTVTRTKIESNHRNRGGGFGGGGMTGGGHSFSGGRRSF